MRMRSTCVMLFVIGSLAGACHKTPEKPPENQQTETPAPVVPVPEPTPPPAQAPRPEPKAKPAPEPTADQQILDDAAATGMTSHASRDEDGSDVAASNGQ